MGQHKKFVRLADTLIRPNGKGEEDGLKECIVIYTFNVCE